MLTYLHQTTATLFKPGGLFQVDKTCQTHAPNCTINNIKMQKALTVGTPPPLARSGSVASLPRRLFLPPPPLKLNPGYATVGAHAQWLRMNRHPRQRSGSDERPPIAYTPIYPLLT